ncbi:helix-turn-helix transcriptional regulator [Phaeobacter inhibens]|uniref:helix-turn-helix transcriptional regulator n=1 Tax=Phaeobacter inhibens TaxID=221822 RepID=UPI0021A2D78D|nr:helix-turn-helix transcriptional regulator [Phaeobacter inhibens]UWR47027.1 helix-turn-helix transcriptional regulator [Phaeobacter inhibens]UWR90483.1 helix-turn-helix transcriptional regulator [Phaeobacter inhibens]
MPTVETWVNAIEIAGFSICCFALILCMTQLHRMMAYKLLACLFVLVMVSDLFDVAAALEVSDPAILKRFLAVSFHSAFIVPPVLLLYVRTLVGEPLVRKRGEALAHLAVPCIATLLGIAFFPFDPAVSGVAPVGSDRPWPSTVFATALGALPFGFYIQCLVYAALSVRAQIRHREKLKDLFASTEPYEVRWITGMAVLFGSFAMLNLFSVVGAAIGLQMHLPDLVDSVLELLIVVTLGAWGLRQSPGLTGMQTSHEQMTHVKYEKSALDPERAERIAGKLQGAMARDQLYRDANLSLASLSKHVGVTTNYVSQTLNSYLDVSFFDFVNEWRVHAAKPMIIEGTQPITLIAYEVGFNSRSSFYTAFRKNVGMTPSQYLADTRRCAAETG